MCVDETTELRRNEATEKHHLGVSVNEHPFARYELATRESESEHADPQVRLSVGTKPWAKCASWQRPRPCQCLPVCPIYVHAYSISITQHYAGKFGLISRVFGQFNMNLIPVVA